MQNKPERGGDKRSKAQFEFLEYVVEEEDYATSIIAENLRVGSEIYVLFDYQRRRTYYYGLKRFLRQKDDKLNGCSNS